MQLAVFNGPLQRVPGVLGSMGHRLHCALTSCEKQALAAQYVLGPYKLKPEKLPQDCPLHPSRDLLWDHEQHKQPRDHANKQCKYCSKVI
jgi:hypothetical protein